MLNLRISFDSSYLRIINPSELLGKLINISRTLSLNLVTADDLNVVYALSAASGSNPSISSNITTKRLNPQMNLPQNVLSEQ